tara:strand:- start:384 stop:656 length:273 start_codon:yes stop_codon:yes gene_type:complete
MEDWISVGDNDTEYQNSINETNSNQNILNMMNGYNNEIEELDSTIVHNENQKKVFFDQTTEFRFDMYTHVKIVLFHIKEIVLDLKKKFCL